MFEPRQDGGRRNVEEATHSVSAGCNKQIRRADDVRRMVRTLRRPCGAQSRTMHHRGHVPAHHIESGSIREVDGRKADTVTLQTDASLDISPQAPDRASVSGEASSQPAAQEARRARDEDEAPHGAVAMSPNTLPKQRPPTRYTRASTRSGLPLPSTILRGAANTIAPVAGS